MKYKVGDRFMVIGSSKYSGLRGKVIGVNLNTCQYSVEFDDNPRGFKRANLREVQFKNEM